MKKNAKLIIGLACMSLGLTACKEDYFDQEKYDAHLKKTFPVENVSPNHTWAVYGSGVANVSIGGSSEERYRIAVYQENPLNTSPATLLANANAVAGQSAVQLYFSYKLAHPTVYVTCFDSKNRRIVEAVTISDGNTYDVNFFGEGSSSARGVTRAAEADYTDSYAHTANDYLNPTGLVASDITVNQISEAAMRQYTAITDADIEKYSYNLGNTATVSATAFYAVTAGNNPTDNTMVNVAYGSHVMGTLILGERPPSFVATSTYTDAFNGGTATITPDNSSWFFEHSTPTSYNDNKFSFNSKFTGCEYEGVTYSNGLKMESTTYIKFTPQTSENVRVTIVQSDWESSDVPHGTPKSIKFDGVELSVADAAIGTGCRIYTINDVAGYQQHSITRGSGESGLFLVKVEYGSTVSPVAVASDSYTYINSNYQAKIPRMRYTFQPTVNGTFSFTYNPQYGDNYNLNILDNEEYMTIGQTTYRDVNNNNSTIQFPVEAGHIYEFYLKAAPMELYGVQMQYSSTDPLGDGKHFRIAKGTTVWKQFAVNTTNETVRVINDCVIYIEGTLHINPSTTLDGPTLVVANGGELFFDASKSMSNCGRIVVLPGGTVSGNYGAVVTLANGAPAYNAGTMSWQNGELNVNGSDFYNCGTVNVGTLRNTSGGKITNFGNITAIDNIIAADAYNCEFINGCYWHYTGSAGIGHLVMLENSRLDIDGTAEFTQNHFSQDEPLANTNPNILMRNSIVTAGNAYCTNTIFQGPSGQGEFAIVKIKGVNGAKGKILVGRALDITQWGNCYFDWDAEEIYDKNGVKQTLDMEDGEHGIYSGVHARITKYVSEETAPATMSIPASECTGSGYNGTPTTVIDDVVETQNSFRFCFEDQFPHAGDYDFNDCVITVTPTVTGNTATVVVSLDAVGANKQIAAAMRIKGLTPDNVTAATNTFTDYAYSYESMRYIAPVMDDKGEKVLYVTSENLGLDAEGGQITDFVVSLFNDAHWVMSGTDASGNNQYMHYYFYNTYDPSETYIWANNNTEPVTMTFTFTIDTDAHAQLFNDAANYDVFIVEQYNNRMWEVHTYPFKFDQVLKKWANYDDKLTPYVNSATKNYPWAILVPSDFLYPIEYQSISGSKIQMSDTGVYGREIAAYPLFRNWAVNPYTTDNNVKEWYLRKNIDDMSLVWQKPF